MTEWKGERCPNCNEPADECKEILIDEVKDTTYIFSCGNCEILWGGYT